MTAYIKKTEDFIITGDGSDPAWRNGDWHNLSTVVGEAKYKTRGKALWSEKGIYFYFECEDKVLSCTKTNHFDELYLEDVIEVFLWTEESEAVYFEYEISPLGYELPLIVINNQGGFHGWQPFLYKTDRKIISGTSITRGIKKPMADVDGWKTEFYIPYKLVLGLKNCPPKPGTKWRVNMCRIDYDQLPRTQWSWSPETGIDFHDYKNFGTFIFVE